MSIGWDHKGKSWRTNWFDCDQMGTIIMLLGVEVPEVESEIPDEVAGVIRGKVQAALDGGLICAKMAGEDSLGRSMRTPIRVVCLRDGQVEGEALPLSADEREWVAGFLKFLE